MSVYFKMFLFVDIEITLLDVDGSNCCSNENYYSRSKRRFKSIGIYLKIYLFIHSFN